MGKRLVVCCDGTWNVPDEARAGVAAPTNVAKLAVGVLTGQDNGQLLFYEPGVGTSPDEHLFGGGFGYGLSQNIRNCYQFLAERYESGDQIYLFGFSRGAYTARSLAGLVRNCGILLAENADRVDEAFAFYRDRTSQTHPSALASQLFRQMYSHDDDHIHCIGVWDTVGTLGIPIELPGWEEVSKRYKGWETLWGFHDTQLGRHVGFAYHALAIDEERQPFKPTLWTRDDPASGQTLEQVWFAGVHTEVGGGARDASLSDVALLWMVERARDCGLVFMSDHLELGAPNGAGGIVSPDYAAPIVNSRRGMYDTMRAYHRLNELPVSGAPAQSIASSAARRLSEEVDGYGPPGLRQYLSALPVTRVAETLQAQG
jgi:uncharacterized protein (DUF2235 family)